MNFLYRQPHIALENLSDEELIRQFRMNGDQTYFVTLFQRYTHLIYGVCKKYLKQEPLAEDAVMEIALEAGAEDVITDDEGAIEVLTSAADFEVVKNALEAAGLVAEMAEVTMRAENSIELTGEDATRMQKLLDVLEDLDDVQNVFHNAEIAE